MLRLVPRPSGLARLLLALALLAAAPYAAADARSDCEAAVRNKLEDKAPHAKKFKFGNKVKSVSNGKKNREELSGTGKYVGKGGEKKEMGWSCVYDLKAGRVKDVNVRLEQ